MVPPCKKKTALLPSSPKESPCKSPNLELQHMAALAESKRAFTSLAFRCSTCELLVIEPAYIAEAINIGVWTEGDDEAG
jgi:hypothetical protein